MCLLGSSSAGAAPGSDQGCSVVVLGSYHRVRIGGLVTLPPLQTSSPVRRVVLYKHHSRGNIFLASFFSSLLLRFIVSSRVPQYFLIMSDGTLSPAEYWTEFVRPYTPPEPVRLPSQNELQFETVLAEWHAGRQARKDRRGLNQLLGRDLGYVGLQVRLDVARYRAEEGLEELAWVLEGENYGAAFSSSGQEVHAGEELARGENVVVEAPFPSRLVSAAASLRVHGGADGEAAEKGWTKERFLREWKKQGSLEDIGQWRGVLQLVSCSFDSSWSLVLILLGVYHLHSPWQGGGVYARQGGGQSVLHSLPDGSRSVFLDSFIPVLVGWAGLGPFGA
jgi:hypothetical protein